MEKSRPNFGKSTINDYLQIESRHSYKILAPLSQNYLEDLGGSPQIFLISTKLWKKYVWVSQFWMEKIQKN